MSTFATRHSSSRAGITLLELLLVLALLVTVAAVAMPNVGRSLDNSRLRSGGEQIRVAWAKARVQAMESGRIYAFRFEPAGSEYVVEPWLSQDDYLESSQLTTGAAISATAGTELTMPVSAARQEKLPDGVQFVAIQTAEDSRSLMLTLSPGTQLPSGGQGTQLESGGQLSAPIFFYPDGTTSTSRLQLTNVRNDFVEVTMRGLTGVVYVKDVDSIQAAMQ